MTWTQCAFNGTGQLHTTRISMQAVHAVLPVHVISRIGDIPSPPLTCWTSCNVVFFMSLLEIKGLQEQTLRHLGV